VANDDPMMASVAGRYASALFDLASEGGQQAKVEQDLIAIQKLLAESADLSRLVRSPAFSAADQSKALSAVLAKVGIGGLTANFLGLVAKNRRLFAAPEMIGCYRSLAARARGEVDAEVTSAVALTDAQLTELKAVLKASAGKDVQISTHVDPSLLGGLVVKMGSRMIDSSIRTRLNNLKSAMKEVG
jgi:F-type H+-transporting ATPase subunit delta